MHIRITGVFRITVFSPLWQIFHHLEQSLIVQREDEENLQREAELRLEAEQAERAAEDARLRELYPLPEDEEEYGEEQYEGEEFTDSDPLETVQDTETSAKEEKKR